jgi:hypothetical protein
MSLPTRFRHCARVWANKPKPQCGRDALIPADELVLITSSLAKTEVLEGSRLGLPNPTKVENILDRSSEILDGDVGVLATAILFPEGGLDLIFIR